MNLYYHCIAVFCFFHGSVFFMFCSLSIRMVILCVGAWLRVSRILPAVLIDSLRGGKSKATQESLLAATVIGVRDWQSEALNPMEPLVAAWVAAVKEAAKKPQAAHVDSVLALRLLLHLSSVSPTALAAVSAGKLWTVISAQNSLLSSRIFLVSAGAGHIFPPSATATGGLAPTISRGSTRPSDDFEDDLCRSGSRLYKATLAESAASILSSCSIYESTALTFPAVSIPSLDFAHTDAPPVEGPILSLLGAMLHSDAQARKLAGNAVRTIVASTSRQPTAALLGGLLATVAMLGNMREQAESSGSLSFRGDDDINTSEFRTFDS